MSKWRFLYLLTLGIGIWLYLTLHNEISILFLSLLIILPLISLIHLLLTMVFFQVHQLHPEHNYSKKDTLHYSYGFRNKSFIPLSPIKIQFSADHYAFEGDAYKTHLIYLMPLEDTKIAMDLVCKYWGDYTIGIKRIVFYDFLRLFRYSKKDIHPAKVHVHPRVVDFEYLSIAPAYTMGNSQKSKWSVEDKELIRDIRPYRQGDSYRDIHWKLSSKVNNFMVKQYEGIKNNSLTLIMDSREPVYEDELNYAFADKVVEVSLAVFNFCLKQGYPVVFHTQGQQTQYDVASQLELGFHQLSYSKFDASESISCTLKELDQLSSLIIVTGDLSEQLIDFLLDTRKQHISLYLFIVYEDLSQEKRQLYHQLLQGELSHIFFVHLNDPIHLLSEGV